MCPSSFACASARRTVPRTMTVSPGFDGVGQLDFQFLLLAVDGAHDLDAPGRSRGRSRRRRATAPAAPSSRDRSGRRRASRTWPKTYTDCALLHDDRVAVLQREVLRQGPRLQIADVGVQQGRLAVVGAGRPVGLLGRAGRTISTSSAAVGVVPPALASGLDHRHVAGQLVRAGRAHLAHDEDALALGTGPSSTDTCGFFR